jgi:ferredoxin-NADP reductase
MILIGVSWLANHLFSWAFDAPTNIESVFITALILTLICSPVQSFSDVFVLAWIALIAMFSKYLLALHKKHLYNPAAIAVVIAGYMLGVSASWWVGTAWMAPFVALGGFFIIRKLQFVDLAWSFLGTSLVVSVLFGLIRGGDPVTSVIQVILHSSTLFLGSYMLTEPLTMPATKRYQMVFGGIVGLLAVPQFALFGFSFTPELALCVGNLFAYIVSSKDKLFLTLQEKVHISSDSFDFIFHPQKKLSYLPGQYMEWTVPHAQSDSRGIRRFFTLASSPTEETIRLGVKFSQGGSSYKKALQSLNQQTIVVGSQLAGEFTLPKNLNQKVAFLAGGIGITPFRSMIKYVLDKGEKRDIVLLYSNKTMEEIAYTDIFSAAQSKGIRVFYTLTGREHIPANWQGYVGRVDAAMLKQAIPDYQDRHFYLSGPHAMVQGYEQVLHQLGVKKSMIKKDYFPGLV